VQYGFPAKAAQASMPMYDLNLLSNNYVAEYRKEGEDGWHRRLAVDNQKRDMVDLESICEVSHSSAAFVGVGNDDDFVAAIYEFLEDISVSQRIIRIRMSLTVDN
jgi:hypothetical protein